MNNTKIEKDKVRIKIISFTDGESEGQKFIPKRLTTWGDANNYIMHRSHTKQNELGYLKTNFKIIFED